MNKVLFSTALAVLLVTSRTCQPSSSPTQGPPPDTGKAYHSEEGHFTFRVPGSWEEAPEKWFQDFSAWSGTRFDLGFWKGHPSPYFLIQIRRTEKEPKEKVDLYVSHAEHIENILEIAAPIRDGSYTGKDLFYTQNPFFIIVLEYPKGRDPDLSLMAKKLCSYGYVIIHYYFDSSDSIEEFRSNLRDVKAMLDTFQFDVGYEYDGENR